MCCGVGWFLPVQSTVSCYGKPQLLKAGGWKFGHGWTLGLVLPHLVLFILLLLHSMWFSLGVGVSKTPTLPLPCPGACFSVPPCWTATVSGPQQSLPVTHKLNTAHCHSLLSDHWVKDQWVKSDLSYDFCNGKCLIYSPQIYIYFGSLYSKINLVFLLLWWFLCV